MLKPVTRCGARRTVLLVLLLQGLAGLTVASAVAARTDAASSTPAGSAFQTMQGFGASSRAFSDPHVFDVQGPAPAMTRSQQEAVLDALYRELGLTRIRPVQPDTGPGPPPVGIEVANDNSDPTVADPGRFNFAGRRLDDHTAIVAAAKARGATTAWISPLNREPWMGVAPGTRDAAEYSEWLLAQVRRFRSRGARLDYLSVANEPSYSRNRMSGEFVRDVIKILGPRLKAEGLLVPFVVPDDLRPSSAAAQAAIVLADPVARKYVGALATHLYGEPLEAFAELRSLARRYRVPLWMTEFAVDVMDQLGARDAYSQTPFDWALLMHDLIARYDVSAVDYFWGYIGSQGADGSALVRLRHDGARYLGFTRTKTFYYFGQYSRFVRPGARRVPATSSNAAVKLTAYYRGDARTIVAINTSSAAAVTTLGSSHLRGVQRLAQTRTSATQNWAKGPVLRVRGARVTVTLPPRSVTTLTGMTG